MPAMGVPHQQLHGSAPDRSRKVLLLVDVINDLEFDGGEDLLPFATVAAGRIAALAARARRAGVAVVYANDNFGRWRSDFSATVRHCSRRGARGAAISRLLAPKRNDYFVLKPRHSAFFASALDVLLEALGARRLIVCGFAGDICILFTAHDAYMRGYAVSVPADCTASESALRNRESLDVMTRTAKVDVSPSAKLRF
jgi:nicotinamidase-related amidase